MLRYLKSSLHFCFSSLIRLFLSDSTIPNNQNHIFPKKSMKAGLTFSTSRVDTVDGTHEFKITSYSHHKSLEVGKFIESKSFAVGGYEWTIRFYPSGQSNMVSVSHVSVYINLASDGTKVEANYELTLVDQTAKQQHKVCSGPSSFLVKGSMWGYNQFLERSLLDGYSNNDCIIIRCRMEVVIGSKTVTEEPNVVTVPSSNIGQQFGQILESGEGSDVRFEVNGETFAAHKFVLAVRSLVFKAQFLGPMKDDNTKKCIQIVDMDATVFKTLLHFIYWDVVPDLDNVVVYHLLEAADRYGLERLRLICEAKLSEGIDIDNVATMLAMAEQHHCLQLKSVCLEYIAQQQNLKAVMKTDGFSQLEQTCPSVVCELMRLIHQ